MAVPRLELNDAQLLKIIALATSGATIMQVCEIVGFSESFFYDYLKRYPSFETEWSEARTRASHRYADEILQISENVDINSNIARNQIQARQWLAAKRNPKVYGDRLEVSGTITLDIAGVLDVAERRVGPMLDLNSTQPIQVAEYTETKLDHATGSKPVNEPSEPEKELTFDDMA